MPWSSAADADARPRRAIGVAADDPHVRDCVRQALGDDWLLAPVCDLGAVDPRARVAAWLVFLPDGQMEDADLPALDALLDTEVPVWLTDESVPVPGTPVHRRWQERMRCKLAELTLDDAPVDVEAMNAPDIWVLGASLGGPDAVKRFLDALPGGLPVGFVYVQHSETRTLEVLARVLGRHSEWQLRLARAEQSITAGDVVLVRGDAPVLLGPRGRLCSAPLAPPGRYSPDISTFLSGSIERLSGLILFSGMGDDGSELVPELARRGLPVWAQSPASCASSAMVDAACTAGGVDCLDEPEGLARRLAQRYHLDASAKLEVESESTNERRACPMN